MLRAVGLPVQHDLALPITRECLVPDAWIWALRIGLMSDEQIAAFLEEAREGCFSKEQEEKVNELMISMVCESLNFYERTEKQLPPKKDNEDLTRDRIFWTR